MEWLLWVLASCLTCTLMERELYDVSYIRYFFAHILQFTFHESACKAAGQYPQKPLHKCSIYKSKKAGKLLGDMLKLGRSKNWKKALKMVTGSEKMSSKSIGAYFKTLVDWLKENRKKEGRIQK
jgi:peptidyl-dipeptidase A